MTAARAVSVIIIIVATALAFRGAAAEFSRRLAVQNRYFPRAEHRQISLQDRALPSLAEDEARARERARHAQIPVPRAVTRFFSHTLPCLVSASPRILLTML